MSQAKAHMSFLKDRIYASLDYEQAFTELVMKNVS
jgi:hypothetical protein